MLTKQHRVFIIIFPRFEAANSMKMRNFAAF